MAIDMTDQPLAPRAGVVQAVPNTAEGLLADRQVVWGNFTKVVLWSSIVVAACLVVLVWAVL